MSERPSSTLPTTDSHVDHIFQTLTPAQVARAAAHGVARQIQAGDVLYDAGDHTVPFVIVTAGQIEAVRPSNSGDTSIVVLGPGQFSGEANMLSGRRSLARVRATPPGAGIEA